MKIKLFIVVALISFILAGCSNVQYNKVFLSDEDMKLGAKSIQKTEISSTSYREGASGSEGGNTGGGCGCN